MRKSIVLNKRIEDIEKIERFVETAGKEMELEPELLYKMNLILEEAFTNIVFYGFEGRNDADIKINLSSDNGRILLEIIDNGKAFNPLEVQSDAHSVLEDDTKIGGLGVLIIKKLSKELKYKRIDEKNHLIITL